MKKLESSSSEQTKRFGNDLAKSLTHDTRDMRRGRGALIIALQGDLGAGKTTFTQGFGRGLGIKRKMASPTFILMRRFSINHLPITNFYHIDAYRIKRPDSLEVLGLKEIFADPKNIVLIEWPEKIKKTLPKRTVWLKFQYGKKENERKIIITG
jgi:tRNA threonylcarbamoyladenosine biosynthesis protein TsaE